MVFMGATQWGIFGTMWDMCCRVSACFLLSLIFNCCATKKKKKKSTICLIKFSSVPRVNKGALRWFPYGSNSKLFRKKGLWEISDSPKPEECPVLGPGSPGRGLGTLVLGVGAAWLSSRAWGWVWKVEVEPKAWKEDGLPMTLAPLDWSLLIYK